MSDNSTHYWPYVRKSFYRMRGDIGGSKTRCHVNHIYDFQTDDSVVSQEYLRCADLAIWAQKNDPSQPHPDGLFMPIVYLFRHSIELALKNIIRNMFRAGRLTELPKKELGEHKIIPLWSIVRQVLLLTWPKADHTPVKNTQALLEELQRIDKTGQNFRYSSDKNGKPTSEKYPQIICLEVLQQAMHEIHTFITACDAHYYEEWQNMHTY